METTSTTRNKRGRIEESIRVYPVVGTLGDARRHVKSSERISLTTRLRVYERAEERCAICSRRLSLKQMEAHHLRRLVDGGRCSMKNLVCLCRPCHKLLHDRWPRVVSRWRPIKRMAIPKKHRQYIQWLFDWKNFASSGSGEGRVSVGEQGRIVEYKWRRQEWYRRVNRPKSIRTIAEGRQLLTRHKRELKRRRRGK